MKHYRAVLTVKPHLAEEASENESVAPLFRAVFDFGVGDDTEIHPEDVVEKSMRKLLVDHYMDYTIERTNGSEPDSFVKWMARQPFGGPSRIPGKTLLSDSTLALMRKAWNAAVENTRLRQLQAAARLPFNPEQEPTIVSDEDLAGL